MDKIYNEIEFHEKEREKEWEKAKELVKDLIHPMYIDFAESHETYDSYTC